MTATAQATRPPTSNPIRLTLTGLDEKTLQRHTRQYTKDCGPLHFLARQGQQFTFTAPASSRHGHAGRTYEIHVGRPDPRSRVTGFCTCASEILCKHLAAAYIAARHLIQAETNQPALQEITFCWACGGPATLAMLGDAGLCPACRAQDMLEEALILEAEKENRAPAACRRCRAILNPAEHTTEGLCLACHRADLFG
jgi:hypothetical protein